MKKKVISLVVILFMIITLIPMQTYAVSGGSTKTIDGGSFKIEISNVYAIDSRSKVSGDGHTTIYFVVVPEGATVKLTDSNYDPFSYNLMPFNDIKFDGKSPLYPEIDYACDYDDTIYEEIKKGSSKTLSKYNEYYFSGGYSTNSEQRNIGVRIFCVDADTLVQFGGPKPSTKQKVNGNVLAKPTNTQFVIKNIDDESFGYGDPKVLKQAYTINNTNYIQLRAIATLLKGTVSEFNVSWDGQYAVIEPGKEFTGTVTGSKMGNTYDVVKSTTKFKMNGEVFTFNDAKLINGSINYIQLREFAQKLIGTESQFNVYWDDVAKVAVIQPGVPYTGVKAVSPKIVLEKFTTEDGIIPDGDYYLRVNDQFIYPVATNKLWIELKRDVPKEPYSIKYVESDSSKGSKYTIFVGGANIGLPFSNQDEQLQSIGRAPHNWRIDNFAYYITIRDYKNQNLIVNASGQTYQGNTKVVGSNYPKEAPESAKITLYKKSNKLIYINTVPSKTTYKVGEAFDITGLNVVLSENGVNKNINDKIKFYTSGTVELYQGRAFTTEGTKVVEIRYDGIKYAEFMIEVTDY